MVTHTSKGSSTIRLMVVALAALMVLAAAGPEPAFGMTTGPAMRQSHHARPSTHPISPAVSTYKPMAVPTTGVTVPLGQTFGGGLYAANPTSVESDVNSMDGALEVSHTDIRVAGIGVPFVLDRQYNSRNVGTRGSFGPGWSSILDLRVRFLNNGAKAVAYGEDGQQIGFTYHPPTKTWIRNPGVRASLTCSGPAIHDVAPATCTVTRFSDGVNWTLSHGRVTDFRTAAHQGLVFAYTGTKISQVTVESTAAKPLVIRVAWNAAGFVSKLTTPTRSVSYTYDAAGDLTAVTDPNGNVWRMKYLSAHRLTGITAYLFAASRNGVPILQASYQAGSARVSATQERLNTLMHDTTFTWSGSGETVHAFRHELMALNGGPLTRVTYTDIYSKGSLIEKKAPLGDATTYQYDRNMDLIKLINPLGSVQTMRYDAFGDELSTSTTLDHFGGRATETFSYDPRHRLVSLAQPVTNYLTDKTTNTYNTSGELTSSTSSGSGKTTYTYDKHALRTSKKDGEGNVTSYSYDHYGNLAGESVRSHLGKSPEGFGPRFAYNEAGEQVFSLPAIGNLGGGHYIAADATRTSYSRDGQERSVTSPGGATSTTQYDAAGSVASSTDWGGRRTTYSWSRVPLNSGLGWERRTRNPAGTTIDVYDPSGNVLSSTPPQPLHTMSGKPAGVVTDFYNADGEVIRTTNGQGVLTTFTRDRLGDVTQTSSRGVNSAAIYNLVGWATTASTTTYSYPPDEGTIGKPQATTTTTHTRYGSAGQVVAATDSAGGTILYVYGPGDQLKTVQDRNGLTRYAYDDLGDVTSVTSPTGAVTKYTFSALGHETSQTIGGQRWSFTYDADGNTVKTVDPDGRTAAYTFDSSNRKTGVTYSWASGTGNGLKAPPVRWNYNKLGERIRMSDGTGTTRYSYDSQGRLLTAVTILLNAAGERDFSYNYSTPGEFIETYPDGSVIRFHTDDGGNLMGLSVPPQSDGTPAFDVGNMMPTTTVTQGASSVATAGSTTGAVSPAMPGGTLYPDMVIGYTFNQPQNNAAGTPTISSGTAFYPAAMADQATSSNPLPPQGAYIAESDLNGNLLGEQWGTLPTQGGSASEETLRYGYNGAPLERPVREGTAPGTAGAGVRLTSWSSRYQSPSSQDSQGGGDAYNGDGNPTLITAGPNGSLNWKLRYNSTGEINSVSTNAPGPTVDAPVFAYDKAGNMTEPGYLEQSRSSLEQSGLVWKLAYNDAGQLASASGPFTDVRVSYTYDGDGNLASESQTDLLSTNTNPAVYSLIWDPRPATPQLAEVAVSQAGQPTYHQRYIWGNGPVGMDENGTAYVLHDNQNGTPTMMTDTSGQTVETSFYDPHGNFLDGDLEGPVPTILPLIGFDGSFTDPATGLDLMGGRWYDPGIGMFTSRGTASPPTPGTDVALSESSMHTIGMSTSAGTSRVASVAPPPTSYGFGAQDPTNQAQPTGTTLAPSTSGIDFKALGEGAYALYKTVSPYALGTLSATVAIAPAKALYATYKLSKTQTPNAAAESAGATEVASEGTTTAEEATQVAGEGNMVEESVNPAAAGLGEAEETAESSGILGKVITVGAMAGAIYTTIEACSQYGSSSSQCIGQALGTSISFTAQLVCDALTAGVAAAGCGLLQNVLATVIPLLVEGNGQAFLSSVTFSSGFNIQDANVLTAQLLIALTLGPIGVEALLGEVIYANFGAISSTFVVAGNAIASTLVNAGQTFVSGVTAAGDFILSGVSTAGAYFESGFNTLFSELSSSGLVNLAGDIVNMVASQINDIVGQVASSLCDVIGSVSCFVSSIFSFVQIRGADQREAEAWQVNQRQLRLAGS